MKMVRNVAAVVGVALVSAPAVAVANPLGDVPRPYQQDWPVSEEFDGCADLILRSVPGTWETEADMDPLTDAGMMGELNQIVRDAGEDAGVSVDAQIINYPAVFGGPAEVVTGDSMPYPESMQTGVQNTIDTLREDMDACPDSMLAVAGFSQGADVAGDVLEQIVSGDAGLDSDRFVGGLIYSDPKRTPSTDTPELKQVEDNVQFEGAEELVSDVPVPGGGIVGTGRDFLDVDDGIYTFCLDGDAVCAMPTSATGVSELLQSMGGDTREGMDTKATEATGFQVLPGITIGAGGNLGALLNPEAIEAVLAFLPTHGGPNGHTAYGMQKVSDGKTPLQWGADTLVARAADGDTLTSSSGSTSSSSSGSSVSSSADGDTDGNDNDTDDIDEDVSGSSDDDSTRSSSITRTELGSGGADVDEDAS